MYTVFSLDETDDFIAMSLRRQLRIEFFNSSSVKSDSVHGKAIRRNVATISENKCAVCGTDVNVTVAHIFKTAANCGALELPFDESNFLCLCGTDGERGTCHDYFDKFQMSFMSAGEGMWLVIGGNHHGKIVTLLTNPRKRAIHTHFARCYLNKSFVGLPEGEERHKEKLSKSFEDESVASDDVDVGGYDSVQPKLKLNEDDLTVRFDL